ncbi:uncharacterized protein VDAG_05012 [Verticillium dahliae VdLs.17]|uniref:RING-type domain-containing protein n=1 Tax=Verticillium dahliae (strain VdLs.17 / ATCC MYA-4575 / FGSC 10137) TaxID=498257 RepID=G2X4D0_VERDV|nr:uncharacterized protein VDAG_05012 [Verticillium dahliae VdLs.17]EGY23574.1 hypothetical protein VDAG_05012 [Verticillium dahliae VdLs.17]
MTCSIGVNSRGGKRRAKALKIRQVMPSIQCSGVGSKGDAAPETVPEDKYSGKAHDSTSIAAKTHSVPTATGLATSLSQTRVQTIMRATASAEHTVTWSQAGSTEGSRLGRRCEDDDITAAPPSPLSPIRMTRGNYTEAEGRDSRPVLSAMPDDTGSAKEGGARQGPLLQPDHGPSLLTNDNNQSRWPSFTFCGLNAKIRERSLESEILVLRGCRHSFHARCLTSWFLQDGFNCPLCRTPFWMQPEAMARAVQRPSNAGVPHGGNLQA